MRFIPALSVEGLKLLYQRSSGSHIMDEMNVKWFGLWGILKPSKGRTDRHIISCGVLNSVAINL